MVILNVTFPWARLVGATLAVWLACGGSARAWPVPSVPQESIPADMPREIRERVEKLYSDDDRECSQAAKELGEMGPAAVSAAPFLASVLQGHYSLRTANNATKALVKMGPAAFDSAAVATGLNNGDAKRRSFHVITMLDPERAAPFVFDWIGRGAASRAQLAFLRRCGEAGRKLALAALASEDPDARLRAVRAMPAFSSVQASYRAFEGIENEIGVKNPAFSTQDTADRLLSCLGDADAAIRAAALESLTVLVYSPDHRLPLNEPIRKTVADPDPVVRRAAIELVVRLSAPDAERIEALAPLVDDPNADVRLDLAERLMRLPDRHGPVPTFRGEDDRLRPIMLRFLGDASPPVRARAVQGLGELKAVEASDAMVRMLNDPVRENAALAAGALGKVGGAAAVDALLAKTTAETDLMVRIEAADALASIYRRHFDGRNPATPPPDGLDDGRIAAIRDALAKAIEGPNSAFHRAAAEALARTPAGVGTNTIPALVLALRSPDAAARRTVHLAMLRGGLWDPRLLDACVEAVRDGRNGSEYVYQILAQKAGPANMAALEAAVARGGANDADCAISALGRMGDDGLRVVLKALAQPGTELVRKAAGETVRVQWGDPKIAAFVRGAQADPDEVVREGARLALAAAEGKPLPPVAATPPPRAATNAVAATPVQPQKAKPPASEAGSQLVEVDKTLQDRFAEIGGWIRDREYDQAIAALDAALASAAVPSFYPVPGDPARYATSVEEATRLIGSLPEEALDTYCRRHGPTAGERYEAAGIAGDEPALRAVARRYYHTPPGGRAVLRIAALAFDRGRCLEAGGLWESLYREHRRLSVDRAALLAKAAAAYRQAGACEKATELLARLRERHGAAAGSVAGVQIRWVDWLDEALKKPVRPVEPPGCFVPPADRVTLGNVSLLRDERGVIARAADPGTELWRVEGLPIRDGATVRAPWRVNPYESLAGDMGRRAIAGGDGQAFVLARFSLYDLEGGSGDVVPVHGGSSLVALAVSEKEGRVAWELGLGKGSESAMHDARFLSAPARAGGRLYVLALREDRYRGLCLDAATGRLLWESALGVVPLRGWGVSSSLQAFALETATERGSPPLVADGRVVFLTNSGIVAALDAARGHPLWAVRYDSQVSGPAAGSASATLQGQALLLVNRKDPLPPPYPAVEAEGRIFCLPCDSDRLLVLDASTGEALERRPRPAAAKPSASNDAHASTQGATQR